MGPGLFLKEAGVCARELMRCCVWMGVYSLCLSLALPDTYADFELPHHPAPAHSGAELSGGQGTRSGWLVDEGYHATSLLAAREKRYECNPEGPGQAQSGSGNAGR
jgi:hypothetical protein